MAAPPTVPAIRAARMASLLLGAAERRTPVDVVGWFGAMQAQDAASGHWSLGVRCAGLTETDVLAAFEQREVVRTWPMRGTIHLVDARDVRWLLDLTGVRALRGAEQRRAQLGLTAADADRAAAVLDEALADGRVATRRECLDALTDAGIEVTGQRGYHLLWYAAQVGITCIGPQRGADQTFVRLADWAPDQVSMKRDDALAELLLRYVRSHGPVSLRDFAGWSGLTMTDAKQAAAANTGRLVPLVHDRTDLWCTTDLADLLAAGSPPPAPVVALPGFDEYMLGYKDRSLHLAEGGLQRVVPGSNGVFRATIVVDGEVAATWTRSLRARAVAIDVDPFAPMTAAHRSAAEASLATFARFLDREARITWTG